MNYTRISQDKGFVSEGLTYYDILCSFSIIKTTVNIFQAFFSGCYVVVTYVSPWTLRYLQAKITQ